MTKPMEDADGKLPRCCDVVIPDGKFVDYALNPVREPDKARAFKAALGYDLENYRDLIDNIRARLPEFKATGRGENEQGKLYTVLLSLEGPNGKTAQVLTGWIDDREKDETRLTTAYVARRGRGRDEG